MSLVRFSPFDDLFRTFANVGEPVGRDEWLPAVDIVENERAYEISVEVPAVARENINVSLKDGVLTVSGERSREKTDGERPHRVERQYGKFVRSFRLPENIDEDGISARSDNGVLHLSIAKAEKAQPRQIEVQVQ